MVPIHYVWLVWSCTFLIPWLVLFILLPRYRPLMLWSSTVCLVFGLTEPFFVGTYWNPPSLFNLAQRYHFDLETFVFCFGIGGVAPLLYHLVRQKPPVFKAKTEREFDRQFLYNFVLVAPLAVFGIVLLATKRPIFAGLAGFGVGIAGRLLCRPDLVGKTLLGGPLFLGYYALFLLLLRWLAPGYLDRVWLADGPAHVHFLGLPVTELAFALGFGMYWSGLCEHVLWSIAWPTAPARH